MNPNGSRRDNSDLDTLIYSEFTVFFSFGSCIGSGDQQHSPDVSRGWVVTTLGRVLQEMGEIDSVPTPSQRLSWMVHSVRGDVLPLTCLNFAQFSFATI